MLEFIKLSGDKDKLTKAVSRDERFNRLSREAFDVLKDAAYPKLKPVGKEGKIHMGNALEEIARDAAKQTEAEVREGVATDMLKDGKPVPEIVKYSKLTEAAVRQLAKSLGVAVL
mgnify:CR=1 FL=1